MRLIRFQPQGGPGKRLPELGDNSGARGRCTQETTMPHDNSTLEERIEELEKADRAKDQYLALLSHEVRNHIHAIRTNVWLIKARNRDQEIARPA